MSGTASGGVVRRGSRSLVSRGADEGPARVLRVDPRDGARGVLRDTLIVLRLSHPADPASVTQASFSVADAQGVVPGGAVLDPAGLVLIWRGDRLLVPDVAHLALAHGLRDRRGRPFDAHASRFVPCPLTTRDLAL